MSLGALVPRQAFRVLAAVTAFTDCGRGLGVGRFVAGVLFTLLFGCGVLRIALVCVVVKVETKAEI